MARTRVLLLTLAMAAVGCAPPPPPPADPVQLRLDSLDLRGRLAQLVVPAESALARTVVAEQAGDEADAAREGPDPVAAPAWERLDLTLLHPPATGPLRDREDETVRLVGLAEELSSRGVTVGMHLFAGLPPTAERWDLARIAVEHTEPLAPLLQRGVAVLVPAWTRLPAMTGDTLPLPLSPAALAQLRRDHGWEGAIAVDVGAGVASGAVEDELAAAAGGLAAGADLLLGVGDPAALLDSLVAVVSAGRLSPARIDQAARRVLHLRAAAAEHARAAAEVSSPSETATGADSTASDTAAAPLRTAAASEAGMNEAALRRVDAAIEAARGRGLFTAGALAVARRGRIVRLRGYGTEPDGDPVDPRGTLFDLASLTKVVATTTAVALLVEEERMSLDAPVQRYLPDFTGEGKGRVTIRHLLAHTSGLPAGLWLYGSARSPEQALAQVLRQPLRRDPGTRAEYSDLGMIVLSAAAEAAAGEPLDRFLARELLSPLGLSNTMFLPPLTFRDRIVPTAIRNERGFVLRGVVHDANAFRLGGRAGHAGLFSTAEDVLVFGQAMLEGGTLGDRRVLQPSTVRAFTARQRGAGTRALGWDTPANQSSAGRFLSSRTFGHTGFTGTSLWIDPELSLVVVLLTNRTYDAGTSAEMQRLRRAVHEGVTAAIRDRRVPRRPGAR